MQKRVLSLLVDNTAGVTTRVSGLFSRRGYNIDSITGGVTADERFSRITVVCSGDELILEQITNQLAKLVDVRDIKILEPNNSVCHELMMIKVAAKPEQRHKMLDNVGLQYPHRASGAKAPRTLRPLPLLRFAVSATGGAHLCSIQYYLRFWLGICRTSLAVSALRIMRYCLYVFSCVFCPRGAAHFTLVGKTGIIV